MSHDYWVREGRRPDVLGETILVNAEPLTIVGVAAAGFTGSSVLFRPDVWLPLGLYGTVATDIVGTPSGSLRERDNYTLMVKGRLRPGHSVESVAPELEAIAARLSRAYPATNEDRTLRAAPLPRLDVSTSPTTDGQFAALSALVLGMAGMVLLIACLNLANMLLARGASRRREMAIRLSLGGGRGFAFERGLLLETDPSLAGYDEVQGRTVYRDLLPRLRALPGVDAVSMASMVPFGSFSESRMAVPVGADDQGERAASFTLVADDYFRALGPAER